MQHVLDNMIWNALATGNRDIAVQHGNFAYYRPDIAPFAGFREMNDQNLSRLHQVIPNAARIAISSFEKMNHNPSHWKVIQPMDVTQMVYSHPVANYVTENSERIVPLTDEHIPQMIELTTLTRPGPFLQRTIEFGNYVGIFVDDRLAAMAGQRMHPLPFLEVSAVCTHPDFRGKGYAKACMLHVMKLITDRNFIPFLHVLTSNITAIRLYESIGYTTRTTLYVDLIEKVQPY